MDTSPTPLRTAVLSDSVDEVRAALPGASQEDVDYALATAVNRRADAVFDFLLPHALLSSNDFLPLANAVGTRNLHALERLVPCPDIKSLENAFAFALFANWEAGASCLADSLTPGQVVPDVAYRAALHGSAQLLETLVPFSSPEDLAQAFLHVVLNGVEGKIKALLPHANVAVVLEGMLLAGDPGRADALFALFPEPLQRAMLEKFPALADFPSGAAAAQRAHLEEAVPQSPESRAPRM